MDKYSFLSDTPETWDRYMYKLIDAYKNPKETQNYERKTVIKELSKGRIPA